MPRHIKPPSKVCYNTFFIQTPYSGFQPINVRKHPELRQALHDSLQQPEKKNQKMIIAEAILECLLTTAQNKMDMGESEEAAINYVRKMLMILDDPDSPLYRTVAEDMETVPPAVREDFVKRVLEL